MVGIRSFLIAAVIASVSQAALAQHGDFAPKVKLILDYLKDRGRDVYQPPDPRRAIVQSMS
jgi:hypothetical protein